MKKPKLETKIQKDGYVVINVQDTYFYTVGMGNHGKNELFGFCHFPFGMFQVIASKYFNNEVIPNKGFFVEEYKIPGLGKESVRSKIKPLSLQSSQLIQNALAATTKGDETQGFSMVLGPDKDNMLLGEEGCSFQYDLNEAIQRFVAAVNADLDKAIIEVEKLREALGIK